MADYLFEIIILFSCVAFAGGLVLFLKKPLHNKGGFLLAFSGAFLMGFCFLHLVPFIYKSDLVKPGLWVVGGFLIQIFFEFLSGGVEHGHFHGHDHNKGDKKFPWVVMLGLCLHAFFEGMPFGTCEHGHNHGLLMGIVLHKVPVALVLGGMFLSAGYSRTKAMLMLLLFACMSPFGAIVYSLIEQWSMENAPSLAAACTGLLVGILLHVATTILFESSDGHRLNLVKLLTIIAGLLLAFISG